MDACTASPMPEISHDSDLLEEDTFDADLESLSKEGGDRILATGLLPPPPSMNIRASSTISQCLAKALKTNSEVDSPLISEYLQESTIVFSKNSFDVLLEPKEWNHAIKILPRSTAFDCRVYTLSPSEWKELDAFLKENLETRCI
jgi:hypothetical protein